MKLSEMQNLDSVGANGIYLRAEGNREWSVVELNCFEKFLRWAFGWLGAYSSTHLTTIAENLKVEINPPGALVQKITALWQRTYPNSRCPLLPSQRPPLEKMNFTRIDPASEALTGNLQPICWGVDDALLVVGPGDIFNSEVPCIVNAANEVCLGGGGIDGAIHDAAGAGLYDLCEALPVLEVRGEKEIRCHTGGAVITASADLSERGIHHIIHAVGPTGRMPDKEELLRSTYLSIMQRAEENGIRKLAIPAISTGIFGFPFGEATEIAIRTVEEYILEHPGKFEQVKFVFLDNTQDAAMNCAWAIHIAKGIQAHETE